MSTLQDPGVPENSPLAGEFLIHNQLPSIVFIHTTNDRLVLKPSGEEAARTDPTDLFTAFLHRKGSIRTEQVISSYSAGSEKVDSNLIWCKIEVIILFKLFKEESMFKFNTRSLVATAIGAALFTVLFMYVKFPTPVVNTDFHTSYGLGAFFAVVFGPIAGALIAFIGHALSDTFLWGSAWWSWVIASGVAGFGFGLAKKWIDSDSGVFGGKEILTFNLVQVAAHLVAWLVVAPVLDILIYSEPVNLVFSQGLIAFIGNAISTGIIGTILLLVYARTRTPEGSLE